MVSRTEKVVAMEMLQGRTIVERYKRRELDDETFLSLVREYGIARRKRVLLTSPSREVTLWRR